MAAYQNTVLVTGGTSGLGYYAALTIAKASPSTLVVIASRTDKEKAADTINAKLKQSNVVFKSLDLGNQANIRSFVSQWEEQKYKPITALVLNAGLQFPFSEPKYTNDGLEMTFGVNHVGHALLFHQLCPSLGPDCRIILTSSGTHDPAMKTGLPDAKFTSVEDLARPTGDAAKASGFGRYSTSKLCNVLWTYALDRHIKDYQKSNPSMKWTANAFDPGLMTDTGLGRAWPAPFPWLIENVFRYININWLFRLFMGPNVHTSLESGEALARLAIANDVQGVSSAYFEGLKEIKSSVDSYDKSQQEDLWTGTIQLVAKDEAERRKFNALK